MKLISTQDRLPNDRTYVLIHLPDRPWGDSDDEVGKRWKVAKFIRGISDKEREALPLSDERRNRYRGADKWSNNTVPYNWESFGPDSYDGQEVDYWCELPEIPQ